MIILGFFPLLYKDLQLFCFFLRGSICYSIQSRCYGLNDKVDRIRVAASVFKARSIVDSSMYLANSGHGFQGNDLAVDVRRLHPIAGGATMFLVCSQGRSQRVRRYRRECVRDITRASRANDLSEYVGVRDPYRCRQLIDGSSRHLSIRASVANGGVHHGFHLGFRRAIVIDRNLGRFLSVVELIQVHEGRVEGFQDRTDKQVTHYCGQEFLRVVSQRVEGRFTSVISAFGVVFYKGVDRTKFNRIRTCSARVFLTRLLLYRAFRSVETNGGRVTKVFCRRGGIDRYE